MQFYKALYSLLVASATLVSATPIALEARTLQPQDAGQKSWGGLVEVDSDGQALFTPIAQATTALLNGTGAASDVYNGINQLDHIVDGTASLIANVLSVPTLGLSSDVGNFLTGPIVQSLTHGTFSVISHVVGDPVDAVNGVLGKAASSYSNSANNLITQLNKMNVDTSSAQQANTQLRQQLTNMGISL